MFNLKLHSVSVASQAAMSNGQESVLMFVFYFTADFLSLQIFADVAPILRSSLCCVFGHHFRFCKGMVVVAQDSFTHMTRSTCYRSQSHRL